MLKKVNTYRAGTGKKTFLHRSAGYALALCLLSASVFPVYGETQRVSNGSSYTLSQVQEAAIKENRLHDTLNTALQVMRESAKAAEKGKKDLEKGSDKLEDARESTTSSVKEALDKVNAGLDKINLALAANPALAADTGLQAQKLLLEFEKQQLSVNASLAELSVNTGTGIMDVMTDELQSEYLSYSAQAEDLERSTKDVDVQVKMVCRLLFAKAKELESSIELLQQKYNLQQKVCEIEKVKLQLGYTIQTGVEEKQNEVGQTALQMQQAKDGLTQIKRQMNDLMGKPLDGELSLSEYVASEEGTGNVELPVYSDELVATVIKNSYKIKALERDIENYRTQIKTMKGANTHKEKAIKAAIKLKELAIQDTKSDLANQAKKSVDAVRLADSAYQQKQAAFSNAKAIKERARTSLSVGLISPLEYQLAELNCQNAELEQTTAFYARDLAWQEYTALKEGTLTDIYVQFKAALK